MKSDQGRRVGVCVAYVVWVVCWLPACTPSEVTTPRTLSIFAASSLTDAFEELADRFEKANPGVHVALSFAGSQVLRLQIEHGAPVDVFASADPNHMNALIDAGLVRKSEVFAHNVLAVIVPLENPAKIVSVYDLPRSSRLVTGADATPVGVYTARLLRRMSANIASAFPALVQKKNRFPRE